MIGVDVESENCRLFSLKRETVHQCLSECTVLYGSEYMQRHNKTPMVLGVEWENREALLEINAVWYKITWQKGTILENREGSLFGTLNTL